MKNIILFFGLMLFACVKQEEQKLQLQTIDPLQVTFGEFRYTVPITDSFPKHFATEFLLQNSLKDKPLVKTKNALSAIRGDTSAFYIDPQSERFTLIMFFPDGQADTFMLKGFDAPPPQILAKIDSQYVSINSKIKLDQQKSIDLEFKMPDRFEYYYPKDCRYEITKGKAVLQSEGSRRSIPIINNSIDLRSVSEGSQLIIQIDSLIRRNYRDDIQLINSDQLELKYEIEYGA